MIRTVFFIVLAALVVFGALQLAAIPGEVAFNWLGWRVVVPAPVLIILLLLFAAVSALLYRFWRSIRSAPRALMEAHRRARRERGYRALTQGMVAVAAGDGREAARQARRADVLLNEPPLTMLLSAQTAQLNGDEDAAKKYFTAMLDREETAFLGLRGLIMQASRTGDRAEAIALAARAHRLRPKTPWVLTTLFDLQVQEGKWADAAETLDRALKQKVIDPGDGRRLRASLLLAQSLQADRDGNKEAARQHADAAWKADPAFTPALLRRVLMLVESGKERAAARLIEKSWADTPHPGLIGLYRRCNDDADALSMVKRIDRLVSTAPDRRESRLALAEAMLDADLWGAARDQLDRLEDRAVSAAACRLMARLEKGDRGDADAANRWLNLAATAGPDASWVCGKCDAAALEWTPLCPNCSAFGTLDWGVPVSHAHALPGIPAEPPVDDPDVKPADRIEAAPDAEILDADDPPTAEVLKPGVIADLKQTGGARDH